MCGIIGIYNKSASHPVEESRLRRMLDSIHHRGPDENGIFCDHNVGIGNVRLSIIDLSGGTQPVRNEDKSVWIVFNGEIYNYIELREELESRGHQFYTKSDTETIVHLYEEYGADCVKRLNGQFALAIWDKNRKRLLLARDRVGIRPLYYGEQNGSLVFGSEVKTLLASGLIQTRIDPKVLDQIFTFWAPLPGASIFEGIRMLPPGCVMLVENDALSIKNYWKLSFPDKGDSNDNLQEKAEELHDLLEDATRLRLRADVTVGAYLSGGIDSSAITALTHRSGNRMRTFSIAFKDKAYDERTYQDEMRDFLGVNHERIECTAEDIGQVFPKVCEHVETPILRTSPAPMFLLSGLVKKAGIKVVLTGEGADEILCGYNIFRESKVRRFWSRAPDSITRPRLLQKLYAYVDGFKGQQTYLENFFKQGLLDTDLPWYSHFIRWSNTMRLKRIFSPDLRDRLKGYDCLEELRESLPKAFYSWTPLAQAQYLEITLFMSGYLLSSQGDRVMMGNSMEGRFPFLDHRVIEFCNALPPRMKLCGMDEKHILKRSMGKILPITQLTRPKQPYRAPITQSFFSKKAPDYVLDLLSEKAVKDSGLFNPKAVSSLMNKAMRQGKLRETEEMALTGVLSTQLIHHLFIKQPHFVENGVMAQ